MESISTFSDDVLNRSHTCGDLRDSDIDRVVQLTGWVRSYRDHGGVVFIDLRDRFGITQVVFDLPDDSNDEARAMYELARALRNQWVIAVTGKVRSRGPERENPKLPTGKIEVLGLELTLLNRSETVPFEPDEFAAVSEEIRLKYRYIDLRRPSMAHNLVTRHRVCKTMRDVLDRNGFLEIETPFLTKSTPEGARDFLVPSRMNAGQFYALPQSPQLFKQILMIGGMDRYFQIVRCFRDEDLRADRQPEFTQLDVEMAFATEESIMSVTNEVMREVLKVVGREFPDQVARISYAEAMDKYGHDAPDMRYELFLHDVGDIVADCEFKVFSATVASGGLVKAIAAPSGAKFTRKEIDSYGDFASQYGAMGLAWCKLEDGTFTGTPAKFLDEAMQQALRERTGASDGDILFFVADKPATTNRVLGALRRKLAADLKLYDPGEMAFCWVVDWPLVEYNDDAKRWDSMHHPFTSPRLEDLELMTTDPGAVQAKAYDIVCNGVELGGGSIRIHNAGIQQKVFNMLGIGEEEAQEKFGFLLDALRLGAPPHGGIALGLDRIIMMLVGATSLRDVIAFPKTQKGQCLMTEAPSLVDEEQLSELFLKSLAVPTDVPTE
jgi:aspartyl-tRNA synthetase